MTALLDDDRKCRRRLQRHDGKLRIPDRVADLKDAEWWFCRLCNDHSLTGGNPLECPPPTENRTQRLFNALTKSGIGARWSEPPPSRSRPPEAADFIPRAPANAAEAVLFQGRHSSSLDEQLATLAQLARRFPRVNESTVEFAWGLLHLYLADAAGDLRESARLTVTPRAQRRTCRGADGVTDHAPPLQTPLCDR